MQALRTIQSNGLVSLVREESFMGREYIVAPVVAVLEMVLDGALLTASEIALSEAMWEGKPVTVQHPQKNGHFVSAGLQEFAETVVIGNLWHVNVEGGKLKGEMWIDVERAAAVRQGDEVLAALRAIGGPSLEVSTGYFGKIEPQAGTFNGEAFTGVYYDITPDHLAVLPDGLGRCSIEDGCGAPRVNTEVEFTMTAMDSEAVAASLRKPGIAERFKGVLCAAVGSLLQENEDLSHREQHTVLQSALSEAEASAEFVWLSEVFDDYVVYEVESSGGETVLLQRDYTLNEDTQEVTLGEPTEVVRRITFEPVVNADGNGPDEGAETLEGGSTMDREAIVTALVANEAVPFDEDTLSGMTDEQLESLTDAYVNDDGVGVGEAPATPAVVPVVAAPVIEEEEEAVVEEDTPTALTEEVAVALNALGATGISEVVSSLSANRASSEAVRAEAVAAICANSTWTPETLAGMTLAQLDHIRASQQPSNFAGMGGPRSFDANADDAPPAPPAVLLKKQA